MNFEIFNNKKPNLTKLKRFGFVEQDGLLVYNAPILNGSFRMSVFVDGGAVSTRVIDGETGYEYVLHNVPSAAGEFVGRVKTEHDAVLAKIADECFDGNEFKSADSGAVLRYISEAYGDEPEFLWDNFPDCAAIRRKDNKKWYAVLLTAKRSSLGLEGDEKIEVLDLRAAPEELEGLVDGKKYFRGYHMNKKHWITICMNGSVPLGEVCAMIDRSYALAGQKAVKKAIKKATENR